jgi:hypothetical protein
MMFLDADDLIEKLKDKETVEQTKLFTQFYTSTRFKQNTHDFECSYVDGAEDGGLDFVCKPDENSFYILQSKFTTKPKNTNFKEIKHEIGKIFKTIIQENTNRRADEFINSLKRNLVNPDVILTINWLTTNLLPDDVILNSQKLIDSLRRKHNIKAIIDFIPIDKEAVDRAIYDNKHDYVPQTGRKILPISDNIKDNNPETSINSIICKVKIYDILKWFKNRENIKNYLQKNIRGFIGGEESDKTINFKIAKSYKEQPELFWYKHNGIIIFVDSFRIDNENLILINPQIVNGGQTITTIYSVWDKNRVNNGAEVLIRVYRQSYEDTETYERTIEIVAALNSQNKVNPSDLKSNDQVQVNIAKMLGKHGYEYMRKREKNAKSGAYKIKMVDLAKVFYCCIGKRPDISARGGVENLFEESKTYDMLFNKIEINKSMGINHRIMQYLTAWWIFNNKNKFVVKSQLDQEYFQYTQYYLLTDIYQKVWEWKLKNYVSDIERWLNFIQSEYFSSAVIKHSRPLVRLLRDIKPSDEKAIDFFRSKQAVENFLIKSKHYRINSLIKEEFCKYERLLED